VHHHLLLPVRRTRRTDRPLTAVHVRRPRLDYESHATGLDRNEVGALLVAAGLSSARDHALVSLLALNGLRVSEATGADIERLGLERGHRTLTVLRKGGKVVLIPLAPRTAPGHRPGRRGTQWRPGLRRQRRRPPRPPCRRTHRPPPGPPSRDQQTSRTPHLAARCPTLHLCTPPL
jgi:integrase